MRFFAAFLLLLLAIAPGMALESTPGDSPSYGPIGGDVGYLLVSTAPSGAVIVIEDISGTRYLKGNTTNGPLNASVHLTATPMRAIIANLTGYRDAVWNITQYPAKGETVSVDLILEPSGEGTPSPAPTTTPPRYYGIQSIPDRIQAEDYDFGGFSDTTPGNTGGAYRQDDVDIETVGGITNVGWIRNGEYLRYTARVEQAGTYTVTARVASPNSGRTATLSVDDVFAATILVPNTGSFDTYANVTPYTYVGSSPATPSPAATPVKVPAPIALSAGTHTLKLAFHGDGQNIDWIEFTPSVPPASSGRTPYRHVTVPGTIEAEDFDLGGEGVAYHDTTSGNPVAVCRTAENVDIVALPGGGYAVDAIEDGEWLAFTVDTTTSPPRGYPYPVEFRVASDRDGRSVQVEVDGAVVRNVSVPKTGSLSTYTWVQTQFGGALIGQGNHTIRLLFHGEGQCLDRVVFRETRLEALGDGYPRPNFTADRTNGTAPLTVRFTDESSDFAYGWQWSFGDGATSSERNPAHTFLQPGVYSVNLTINEEGHWGWLPGTSDTVTGWMAFWDYPVQTKTVQVTVNGAGPGTTHTVPGTIQAEDYDSGGEGVAYHDITPGNAGSVYRQDDVDIAALPGGGYAVTGIEDGEWLSYSVDGAAGPVGYLPPIGFYLASDRGGGSVQVEVDGKVLGSVSVPNTGNLSAFRWVQTQYFITSGGSPLQGRHTLRLLFHGGGQSLDRIESPHFVSFADAYAMPKFSADRTNGTAPLTVRFTDESSEFAYYWSWDFGDGATSLEQNPVHTFRLPGVYNVSLMIAERDHWSGGTIIHSYQSLIETKTVQVTGFGTTHTVPGTIQAEDYDSGGEGVAYHDTTAGNSGGAYRQDDVDIEQTADLPTPNVGWIRNGEWLAYTATVAASGTYMMTASVASPNSGRTVTLQVDGAPIATIAVPNTGSYAAFRTVSVPVTLPAGIYTLKLAFQGDGQNIDWFEVGNRPITPPTPEAGGASFTAAPPAAPKGSAVKFSVTPSAGRTIRSAWWTFDSAGHYNTWNSRTTNPTFYYPARGTFSPLVKLIYTDGSTETVERANYIRAT